MNTITNSMSIAHGGRPRFGPPVCPPIFRKLVNLEALCEDKEIMASMKMHMMMMREITKRFQSLTQKVSMIWKTALHHVPYFWTCWDII